MCKGTFSHPNRQIAALAGGFNFFFDLKFSKLLLSLHNALNYFHEIRSKKSTC